MALARKCGFARDGPADGGGRRRRRHEKADRRSREAPMTRSRIGWLLLVSAALLATALTTVGADDGAAAVEPCTDFYAYANAGWLAANPIPEGQSRWSPRAAG